MEKLRVGDKVTYHPYGLDEDAEGGVYEIEQDYGNGVYFIGNADSFVDIVSTSCLRKVKGESV